MPETGGRATTTISGDQTPAPALAPLYRPASAETPLNVTDERAGLGSFPDWGAIYRTTLPRLVRLAAGLGLARADAEDALHDTYVAALEHPPPATGPDAAGRWLTRVMVNRCLVVHRRRKRERRFAQTVATGLRGGASAASPSRAPAAALELAQQQAAVWTALDELSEEDLTMIVLRYFCDLNATQIGATLELPAPTVRTRLRAARLRLAAWFSAHGLAGDALGEVGHDA
jgi:RNA polymerase sigma-70 factor, ECF subfamily